MSTPDLNVQLFAELQLLPPEHPATPFYLRGLEFERVTLTECQTVLDLLELANTPSTPPELHALLLTLFATHSQGSLCLPLDAIDTELAPLCGDTATETARRIRTQLEESAWDGLIGPTDLAPVILQNDSLYFQRYYHRERSLAERIRALCQSAPPALPENTDLVALTRTCGTYGGFALNMEQRWGVYLACRNRYTIISGGPGTGKTTLVASLLRALWHTGTREPTRIHLVAPTGRAANRLGQSLRAAFAQSGEAEAMTQTLGNIEGSTIHRLLRYSPSRHAFLHDEHNPIDSDLVICDEVSMIDVILMDQLLAAIPAHARVIFLGDRDQLPSVEAGAVLGELIPRDGTPTYSDDIAVDLKALGEAEAQCPTTSTNPGLLRNHVVLLQQSHRTKGDVSRMASAINAGDQSALDTLSSFSPHTQPWPLTGATCHLIDSAEPPESTATAWVRQLLCSETTDLGKSYATLATAPVAVTPEGAAIDSTICDALFSVLLRGQILTLTRHGATGCETLNRTIMRQLRGELAPHTPVHAPLFPGLPIMVTRNDRLHGLYNGDIGIILQTDTGELAALFPRSGNSYAAIPIHQLPQHTAAFAITIHKSQGSEYGNVLIFLPDDPCHRLLTRELLYTGMTRTKGNAFLYATSAAIAAAVNHPIRRYSGTSQHLL